MDYNGLIPPQVLADVISWNAVRISFAQTRRGIFLLFFLSIFASYGIALLLYVKGKETICSEALMDVAFFILSSAWL